MEYKNLKGAGELNRGDSHFLYTEKEIYNDCPIILICLGLYDGASCIVRYWNPLHIGNALG